MKVLHRISKVILWVTKLNMSLVHFQKDSLKWTVNMNLHLFCEQGISNDLTDTSSERLFVDKKIKIGFRTRDKYVKTLTWNSSVGLGNGEKKWRLFCRKDWRPFCPKDIPFSISWTFLFQESYFSQTICWCCRFAAMHALDKSTLLKMNCMKQGRPWTITLFSMLYIYCMCAHFSYHRHTCMMPYVVSTNKSYLCV